MRYCPTEYKRAETPQLVSLRPTLRRAATDLAKLLEEYNPLRLKSITRQNTQQPLISGLSVSLFFNWLTSSSANTGDGNGVGASEDKGSPGSEFRGTNRFLVGLYVGHRAGIATVSTGLLRGSIADASSIPGPLSNSNARPQG
jgi:hypothetical protein